MSEEQRVLIINRANPELNYLAAFLFRQLLLLRLVRPYYYGSRSVEKILASLLPEPLRTSTFFRRRMPEGLGHQQISEGGVFEDMLMMSLVRVIGKYPSGTSQLSGLLPVLDAQIYSKLVKKAQTFYPQATHLVGTEGLGLGRLESNIKVILNAPLVHPDAILRITEEQGLQNAITAYNRHAQKLLDIRAAELLLVGSQFARSTYLDYGVPDEKIKVVPFGVDLNLFGCSPKPEQQSGIFRITFAGRFVFQKGIDTLIEAFAGFDHKDAEMVMAGSMTEYGRKVIGTASGVRITGQLTQQQLADMFRKSHVFVFPTRYEGMGLTVLQAMACGLPVITTDHGPGTVVRDGVDGFIIPVDSPAAIIDKLEYLYQHPDERARMGKNASRRASLFSWDNYASAAADAIFEGKETHPGLVQNGND